MCNTEYDWKYRQYSSRACLNTGGVSQVCSGKMLGGSTSINAMLYSRGSKSFYDDWAIKYKNPGWSYDDVLPYFKKSEQMLDTSVDPKYHGFSGPMKVSRIPNFRPRNKMFVDAALELNITMNDDFNGANEIGIGGMHIMAADGRRSSSVASFINPVKDRPNLFVMKHATVTKILINEAKVAYGVKMSYKGESEWIALATKEVIVSAGVLGSPKLLLLSGIGPIQQLTELNIPVKQNLPVGENLMDHLNTFLFFKAKNVTEKEDKNAKLEEVFQLAVYNSGPLTKKLSLAAFLNTKPNQTVPNYETLNRVLSEGTNGLLEKLQLLGFNKTALKPLRDINKNYDVLRMLFYMLTPESLGTVKLRSSNPFDELLVDNNYLATQKDLNMTVDALERQILFANTSAFRAKSAELIRIPMPPCDDFEYPSRAYWECYVRIVSAPGLHQCCTNRMGPASDSNTVVDSQLREHGIHHLRVMDASV